MDRRNVSELFVIIVQLLTFQCLYIMAYKLINKKNMLTRNQQLRLATLNKYDPIQVQCPVYFLSHFCFIRQFMILKSFL